MVSVVWVGTVCEPVLETVLSQQVVPKKPVLETPKPQDGMVLMAGLTVPIPTPKIIHFLWSIWPIWRWCDPRPAQAFLGKKERNKSRYRRASAGLVSDPEAIGDSLRPCESNHTPPLGGDLS